MNVTLTQVPAASRLPGLRPDDRSTHRHRQLIGYIGLALPLGVALIATLFPMPQLERGELLGSVSSYFHTAASWAFVGTLSALAVFLFTYRGYANESNWADRTFAVIAGVAALGVAAFPTHAPDGVLPPSWWQPWMAVVHYISAATLFISFIVFALWLFRKSAPGEPMPRDKVWRNRVHLLCGLAMVGAIVWAALAGRSGGEIFWPETIALIAFAFSWLTKGRAGRSIAALVRR